MTEQQPGFIAFDIVVKFTHQKIMNDIVSGKNGIFFVSENNGIQKMVKIKNNNDIDRYIDIKTDLMNYIDETRKYFIGGVNILMKEYKDISDTTAHTIWQNNENEICDCVKYIQSANDLVQLLKLTANEKNDDENTVDIFKKRKIDTEFQKFIEQRISTTEDIIPTEMIQHYYLMGLDAELEYMLAIAPKFTKNERTLRYEDDTKLRSNCIYKIIRNLN